MTNQLPEELSAREAAEHLGVKLPTLYAYVSRACSAACRRRPAGRAAICARTLEALRERGPERRSAAGALRWGEPILESAITAMTLEGPAYRGQLAATLAVGGVGFEAVAELLWTGALPETRPRWEPGDAPEIDGVLPLLPKEGPHASVFPVLVAAPRCG